MKYRDSHAFHARGSFTFTGQPEAGAAGSNIVFTTVVGDIMLIDTVFTVTTTCTYTGTNPYIELSINGTNLGSTSVDDQAPFYMTAPMVWAVPLGTVKSNASGSPKGAAPTQFSLASPGRPKYISTNGSAPLLLTIGPDATLTGGVVVFDFFYKPITPGATISSGRSKYVQPFPATSIWNHPIMDSAVYVAASIPVQTGTSKYVGLDEDIIVMDYTASTLNPSIAQPYGGTDPWTDTSKRCSTPSGHDSTLYPWPPNFYVPIDNGTAPNNPGCLITSDGDTYYEMQPVHRCVGKPVTYWDVTKQGPYSLSTGDGIAGAHGGSNMSAVGGAIRFGELVPGGQINHALKLEFNAEVAYSLAAQSSAWTVGNSSAANPTLITITGHPFNTGESITFAGHSKAAVNGAKTVTRVDANTVSIPVDLTGGGGTGGTAKRTYGNDYRWPATNSDTGGAGGTVPEMRYGSLVALKTNFNYASLTQPAQIIAKALINYGAYVVDSTSDPPVRVALCVERNPQGSGAHNSVRDEFLSIWGYDMYWHYGDGAHSTFTDNIHTMVDALYVVDNNTSATYAGGGPGTPIAPWAGPFI